MSKIMETVYKGNKQQHLLLDKTTDSCPVCDTPLIDVSGSWNMFHGEVSANCCGAPYQTKDYYVDPEVSEGYDEYFEELNKPNYWSLSISDEWLNPLRGAIEQTGIRNIRDEKVMNIAKELKGN